MSHCDKLSDAGLCLVGNMRALRELHMAGLTKIKDAGLENLAAIHTLNMNLCVSITSEGLEHLAACTALNIGGCSRVKPEGVLELLQMDKLRKLWAWGWGPADVAAWQEAIKKLKEAGVSISGH